MNAFASLVGRILLSIIFIMAGYGKISGYDSTVGYMEQFGIPGALLPAVIALELGGGLLILVGFMSRWTALVLAGFTLIAAGVFHSNFGDQMQTVMFMKNLAIAGGLVLLFANGPGRYAINDA